MKLDVLIKRLCVRLGGVTLFALLAITQMPMVACADKEIVDGIEWTYTIKDGEAQLLGAKDTTRSIAIPSTLGGFPVTSIGRHGLGSTFLRREFGSNCGWSVFGKCPNVTHVTISSNVSHIGFHSFAECTELKSIQIPPSVRNIDSGAFKNCRALSSMKIPLSVRSIGEDAFSGTSFYKRMPEGMVILGGGVLLGYKGTCPASMTIPLGVTSIGGHAFAQCELEIMRIPDGVTRIGPCAFAGCKKLKSVSMPESVTKIAELAFVDCICLTNVTISPHLMGIEAGMFLRCSELASVIIPQGVTNIGVNAFTECMHLTNIVIPSSVMSIGVDAFSSCFNLQSMTISSTLTNLGVRAFSDCPNLKSVNVESNGKIETINFDEFCKRWKLKDSSGTTAKPQNHLVGQKNAGREMGTLKERRALRAKQIEAARKKLEATENALREAKGKAQK